MTNDPSKFQGGYADPDLADHSRIVLGEFKALNERFDTFVEENKSEHSALEKKVDRIGAEMNAKLDKIVANLP